VSERGVGEPGLLEGLVAVIVEVVVGLAVAVVVAVAVVDLGLSLIGRFPNVMCGNEAIDCDMSAISRVLRAESSAWMD